MHTIIRKSASANALPLIHEHEQFESPTEPACTWQTRASQASRIALRVTSVGAAHFAVGMAAGACATTGLAISTGMRPQVAHAQAVGLVTGSIAAVYGTVLGAGWAQGAQHIKDVGASVLGTLAAGMAFPVGGVIGGNLAFWSVATYGALTGHPVDMARPYRDPIFSVGAEKGAVLTAMLTYGACRWFARRSVKNQADVLPVTHAKSPRRGARPWNYPSGVPAPVKIRHVPQVAAVCALSASSADVATRKSATKAS